LVFKEYNKIRYEYGNKILLTLESEQDFSEKGVVTTDTLGGTQEVTFLTEKGLYKGLFKMKQVN